jgi:hypothetical protein
LCGRLLPHHHDTGGFFVALIRKVKDLPSRPTPGSHSGANMNRCRYKPLAV